jgi:Family of unknown function (DUF5675)
MTITCYRTEVSERGSFGEVRDESMKFLMYTGEHAYQQADGSWAPKVPAGTYVCQRGTHMIPTGESFDTFQVMDVPGHTGILFPHPGNNPQVDSDGCFLSGRSLGFLDGKRAVIISRPAYESFMAAMGTTQSFYLVVTDPVCGPG